LDAITRRQFLQLVAQSGVGLALSACNGPNSTPATSPGAGPTAPSNLPWSVWEAMRSSVRTSPDHLAATAQRLVEAGDPRALFTFVRDSLTVYPANSSSFENCHRDRLWGSRGVLRSGVGTPREQADLLAELFRAAGLDAKVLQGTPDTAWDGIAVLAPRKPLWFDPDPGTWRPDEWHRLLGISAAGESRPELDPDGADSQRLADRLLDALPTRPSAPRFNPKIPRLIPLVAVTTPDGDHFATPLLPDAEFGHPYATNLAPIGLPGQIRTVRVSMEVGAPSNPLKRIVVAEGAWNLADLVGRRLIAGFRPSVDAAALAITAAESVTTFDAYMALDGVDLSLEDIAERSVLGDSVTVFGDVVHADGDTVSVNGAPLGTATGDERAGTIKLAVRASAFPKITLVVGPTDGDTPMPDLPASSFMVTEDGRPRSFFLLQNRPPPPRVLLMFDGSGCVPQEFQGVHAAGVAFDIATTVQDINSGA
jgi:hypothetical protein